MPSAKHKPRVFYRISLVGWMFIVIAMTAGMAAERSQQSPLMFLIFGGLMGGVLASAVLSRQMIMAVNLRRDVTDRAWQNQTVHLSYYLRNTRRSGSCLGISVDEVAPQGIQSAGGYCVYLPPGQVFRAGARFVCRDRGRITLDRTRISTAFPFGLVTAYSVVGQRADLIVWPARGRLRRQVLNRGAALISAAAPSLVSGGQDEFFGLREYRQDDSPRWIHWRKTAARGTPIVREMSRPLPEVLWVILDTHCASAEPAMIERREQRIRFAATLVDHALTRQYQVALALAYETRTAVFNPSVGRGHRCVLLDALADIGLNTSRPIEQVLADLPYRMMANAQVIVVTDDIRLAAGAQRLRPFCRHLRLVDHAALQELFEEDETTASGTVVSPARITPAQDGGEESNSGARMDRQTRGPEAHATNAP